MPLDFHGRDSRFLIPSHHCRPPIAGRGGPPRWDTGGQNASRRVRRRARVAGSPYLPPSDRGRAPVGRGERSRAAKARGSSRGGRGVAVDQRSTPVRPAPLISPVPVVPAVADVPRGKRPFTPLWSGADSDYPLGPLSPLAGHRLASAHDPPASRVAPPASFVAGSSASPLVSSPHRAPFIPRDGFEEDNDSSSSDSGHRIDVALAGTWDSSSDANEQSGGSFED